MKLYQILNTDGDGEFKEIEHDRRTMGAPDNGFKPTKRESVEYYAGLFQHLILQHRKDADGLEKKLNQLKGWLERNP